INKTVRVKQAATATVSMLQPLCRPLLRIKQSVEAAATTAALVFNLLPLHHHHLLRFLARVALLQLQIDALPLPLLHLGLLLVHLVTIILRNQITLTVTITITTVLARVVDWCCLWSNCQPVCLR